MNVFFVYEGRLGSTRADSTYVQENAEITKVMAQVSIINSRRTNWSIPKELLNNFDIISLGKPFDPKNIVESILGQLRFGVKIRRFLIDVARSRAVLIFHNWWALQALRGLGRNRKRFIFVLEVHDQLPLRRFWPKTFANVDLFIATNKHKYEELRIHFGDKVLLEKNCVRVSRYESKAREESLRKSWGILPHEFAIGYTGSFGPEKNPTFIAECAQKTQDKYIIAGKIPSALMSLYDSTDNLILLGPRDRDEIPLIQSSCDALLVTLDPLSKQSALYTSTMKLLEYIAARSPIIAPRLPSVLELLDETEFYPFEADSSDSFCEALKLLRKDVTSGAVRLPKPGRIVEYSWLERNSRILARCGDLLNTKR